MTRIGYALSSEEHGPNDLVENASEAERRGFEFALISDHFHPWTTTQGESPFVWSTIGGIARETEDLELGTGVTAPIIRIHPAIIAQAAATAGAMMPDRFFLGVGTGENLNEHVLGDRWPEHGVRLEMLDEAVAVIRKLWEGGNVSHHGKHYDVENAQVFTVPDDPPPIHVAAGGDLTASAAAEFGDGLIGTSPEEDLIETFVDDAGDDAPRYGQVTACYAEDERTAKEKAYEWWPNGALEGELGQVLPSPKHFEQAAEMLSPDDMEDAMALGPDPDDHVEMIQEYVDAGYDHVYVHGVGPDQSAFLEFYEEAVLPSF